MSKKISITTVQQGPHLLPKVLELVENAFEYFPPHEFAIDFYPLIKNDNSENLYVLCENDTPVAHVGVLPKILCLKEHSFPVALIGGIATAEANRGKGYFDKLITYALKNHSHCMGYFLWGGAKSLYEKYGFHQIGVVRQQKGLSFSPPSDYSRVSCKNLSPRNKRQLQNIHHLNTQNFISLQRNWSDVENITSAHLYIKQNKNSEITNYFFVGKGRDFPEIVHETFGLPGHPEHLPSLTCWMPDTPAYAHLPALYGCLFKTGNPGIFKNFAELYSGNTLDIRAIHDEGVSFSFQGNSFQFSMSDFLTGLLGPDAIEEFKKFYMPLWFGGVDSI